MILRNIYFWSVDAIILWGLLSSVLADPNEIALLDKLLKDYNSQARPVLNTNDTMDIKIGISLRTIFNSVSDEDILSAYIWLNLRWVDVSLRWNPMEYGGITSLDIPPHRIWKPDVYIRNSIDEVLDNTYHTYVVVSHDGNCTFKRPGLFKSSCETDVINYPFDEHNCSLPFGSWTSNAAELNLQLESKNGGDSSKLLPRTGWELIGIPGSVHRVYHANNPEPFTEVTFTIELRRRGEAIFSGCCFVLFLGVVGILSTFLLPLTSAQRIPLGVVTLLAIFWMEYSIETTFFRIPKPSKLVSYFRKLTILVSISVMSNGFILYIYNLNPSIQKMPALLRKIVLEVIPRFILLSRPVKDPFKSPGTGKRQINREPSQNQYEELVSDLQTLVLKASKNLTDASCVNDWEYFAIVLNRLTFLLFIVASILFFIGFYRTFAELIK